MACAKCGVSGHNSRTCPEALTADEDYASPEDRDYALWIKYDNLTPPEADKLLRNAIEAKGEIAPEGRGTFVKGPQKELPGLIQGAEHESKKIR